MSRHRSHPGRARRRAEARLERVREYLSLLDQGRLHELRALLESEAAHLSAPSKEEAAE